MDDSRRDRHPRGVAVCRTKTDEGMNTTPFPAERSGKRIDAVAIIERYGLLVFCAILVLLTAAISPAFRSPPNLQNVLTNVPPPPIAALRQSTVILAMRF